MSNSVSEVVKEKTSSVSHRPLPIHWGLFLFLAFGCSLRSFARARYASRALVSSSSALPGRSLLTLSSTEATSTVPAETT